MRVSAQQECCPFHDDPPPEQDTTGDSAYVWNSRPNPVWISYEPPDYIAHADRKCQTDIQFYLFLTVARTEQSQRLILKSGEK